MSYDFGPREHFCLLGKIYQMIPILMHLSKVENSGPDWSGPVVQVAPRTQKMISLASVDQVRSGKGGGDIF